MEASPQSSDSPTTFMDLSDDCLREVFAHLNESDLCSVADVCNLFRENAVRSARLKFKKLKLFPNAPVKNYSKLRIFGASIEWLSFRGWSASESRRLIEIVSQCCVGKLVKLELNNIVVTNEVAFVMRPLLGRVQEVILEKLRFREILPKNLPLWSPELLDLKCWQCDGETMRFIGIRQKLPKMESISIIGDEHLENSDFTEFLKQNPQLKKLELHHCNNLDNSIFQTIAKHVPYIERMGFNASECFFTTNEKRKNIKYFGELSALKTLTFQLPEDYLYLTSIVHEIASANIALEFLALSGFIDMYPDTIGYEHFIGDITKFKNLKSLVLRDILDIRASQLIHIVKHLKELSLINLGLVNVPMMTQNDLLQLIRNAPKSHEFRLVSLLHSDLSLISIDVNTPGKLLDILEQRSDKTQLKLRLQRDIPDGYRSSLLSIEYYWIRLSNIMNKLEGRCGTRLISYKMKTQLRSRLELNVLSATSDCASVSHFTSMFSFDLIESPTSVIASILYEIVLAQHKPVNQFIQV